MISTRSFEIEMDQEDEEELQGSNNNCLSFNKKLNKH